jgi:hypothetical protein
MYALGEPRLASRSRRGNGVDEYRIRVNPPPPRHVRTAFNQSRSSGARLPKLVGDNFIVICRPERLDQHLAELEVDGLAHLQAITELVGPETAD